MDLALNSLQRLFCHKTQINKQTEYDYAHNYYMYEPKSVQEDEMHNILWDGSPNLDEKTWTRMN